MRIHFNLHFRAPLPPLTILLILMSLTGCHRSASRPNLADRGLMNWTAQKPPLLASSQTPFTDPYRPAAGDVLKITPRTQDPPIRVEIPIDGVLRLHGIPPVHIDGLTTDEIEGALRPYLDGTVEVLEHKSQIILVAGIFKEKAPRPVPYQGPETIEALLKRISCPDCQHGYRVRVVRPNPTVGGEPQIFAEEFDANSNRESDLPEPIRLQPGDYVYVEQDFGRKGPLTIMTDRKFFDTSLPWLQQLRVAQASEELEVTK